MEQSDILEWVVDNANVLMPETPLASAEIAHIAMCMHHVYLWYTEGYPLGSFLTALVKNDFNEACFRADNVNRKALYLYALFLANKIGSDYRGKAGTAGAMK